LGQIIYLITDVSKLVNSSEPEQRIEAQEAVLMSVLSIRRKEISHVPRNIRNVSTRRKESFHLPQAL
jgi:hypothetical protein